MPSARFILGRAGSGKTRHLLGVIADLCTQDPLGLPVYWLLPKQATFQAERLLTATLGGFARVRVVDFDRLSQTVLDHCGDVGIPEVTAVGRRMVIGHLLRTHRKRLKYYGDAAHRPGLAAELDATFGEFERAGLDAPALDTLLAGMDAADPATDGLRLKLADVHLLLDAYVAYIGQDRLDPRRRLERVLDNVAHCGALRDAVVLVDDFYDFTAHERAVLAGVAAVAARTEVALLVDPGDLSVLDPAAPLADLSVFHRTTRTYRAMLKALRKKDVPVEPPLLLRGTHGRTAELAALERGLFANTPAPAAVEFLDAPDARAEVDAVARQIRQATTSGGLRLRDVAVLVRSLGDYGEIVRASFGEHGIPYFADVRRSAVHHPVLQVVRACLLVVRHTWPADAVMALAKSGLAGLGDDAADELENYVLHHRIRGRLWESPDPWQFRRDLTRGEGAADVQQGEAERVDGFRRTLVDALAPLLGPDRHKAAPVRHVAGRLFAVLENFGVRPTLARWMAEADAAGDVELRDEHEQVWAELLKLADQMVDLIGDEPVTPADFSDVLDSGLEGFDLAVTPPTVDGVLLGQVDRTRTPPVKLVFVLGLNEGQFPLARREELVLSDAERRSLRKRDVDLDEDTERQLLDERFLAYVAFTRPTDRLVVTRPLGTAKGKSTNPSLFWLELQRLAPAARPQHVPRATACDPDTIGTPRQLVDALMRWVLTGDTGDAVLPSLYQWLATHETTGDAIDTMRFRAWRALSYTNAAKLAPGQAAELFPLPLSATVGQLETAAACPFQHFARYGLHLTARAAADVTGLDLHAAYHTVLEHVTRELMAKKTDWCAIDAPAAQQLIRTHAAAVGRQLRGELMLSTARNRYLLAHIERTLERAVASMAEFHRRGTYRPAWAALRFGGNGATLSAHAVRTPLGRDVNLHGRIDRVDLNDRRTAFTVADYKLAPAALQLDRVYYGLSLQLLTYLLVVRAGGEQLAGHKITPAAAFLLGLLRSPGSVAHPDKAMGPDDPHFHLRHKPRGLIDDRAVDSLDGSAGETGPSKVVAAYRKKDGTFGNRHNTDVADAPAFNALLAHVDRRLGEAADRVLVGDVAVRPYLLGRESPCGRCDYRTVCRFEPGVDSYRVLQPLRREDVLQRVLESPEVASAPV